MNTLPQRTNGNAAKDPAVTLHGLLQQAKGQIALALPKHLTADRLIRIALTACRRTPALLECDTYSVVGCVMQSAQLGLEMDGVLGHAYMVPYHNKKTGRKEAQFIVGYKGLLTLARNSGEVSYFAAHVVHEHDHFVFSYGTDQHLEHTPNLAGRGQPIAVYAVLKLRNGDHDFEVMSWEEIARHRDQYSKASGDGPWRTAIEEMARKTVIRRLAKRCPVSVELQRAAALDEYADAGVSQSLAADARQLIEQPAVATPPVLAPVEPTLEEDIAAAEERAAIQQEGARP